MAFQFPYRAIICGEEHIVKSWQGRKLITSGGNYSIGHIYGDSTIHNHRLLEITMIRSDGNDGWLLNDKPLSFLAELPMGLRFQTIENDENLRVRKDQIQAVAWFDLAGNSPKVTELLDEIKTFWKTSAVPLAASDEEPSIQKALEQLSRSLLNITKYRELFSTWSKPVWLTEFRPAAPQKRILAKEKKLLAVTTELEQTKKLLHKAEAVANDTLKEALSKWMRFDPPRMSADVKARIEKAVKIYTTEPKKRSLAKIAAEFKVTRKTVSEWFKKFTVETGFPVVTHYRHESVMSQFQSAYETDENEDQ